MSGKKDVQLYCAWYCPYAQRARIALLEKNVEFEYIETDPYNKTPEFLAVNPRGLVPTIVHKGRTIYESSICLEYIDEVWPENPKLLPTDPYERAVARIWVDFLAKKLIPVFYKILQKQDKEGQEKAEQEFLTNLAIFTREMSDKGPFFFGDQPGFVDIILVPWSSRLYILKHYRQFEVPHDGSFARFHEWMDAAHSLPSVKATMSDPEKLVPAYARFVDDAGK